MTEDMPEPTSRSGRAPSGWLRARLRAAHGTALMLAALCFLTTFTATATPRAVDAFENDALRDVLDSAPLRAHLVTGTVLLPGTDGRQRHLATPRAVKRASRAFDKAVASMPTGPGAAVSGVANALSVPVLDERLPRITATKAPEVTLAAQPDVAGHSRVTEGRLPGRRVQESAGQQRFEAAVTGRTAQRMKLRVGDSFRPAGVSGTIVTVTGIIAPRNPRSLYWNAEETLSKPVHTTKMSSSPLGDPDEYWHFGALIHPEAAPALLVLEGETQVYVHHPLDEDAVRAHDVPALVTQLTSLDSGPSATRLTEDAGVRITIGEELGSLLLDFEGERATVAPLLAMATTGVATAAGAVLLLWGILSAERRRDEWDLIRSRGGSVPGLAGRLLAENAVPGLPAAAAGCALALLLTPGTRTAPALAAASLAAAFGLLSLPLRAAYVHRRPFAQTAHRPGAGHGRRRLVVEVTVLVLVVAAVVTLRQRGDTGGTDPLPAAAPVLLSVAAALVLMRALPLPLRLLARAARRRTGPVAFLGLARASRGPFAAVVGLPVLSLLVALTVSSFGGMVLAGVEQARERSALLAVGADARVASPVELPARMRAQLRGAPGVQAGGGP
ncbi:hypothetical protein N566_17760, partial [Streptomycetaceae bacterium MP113-05]